MALVAMLEEDASDLIESFQMQECMRSLRDRLSNQDSSTAGKLTHGILNSVGSPSAFDLSGEEFALAAEGYYRRELRAQYLREACECVREELCAIDQRVSEQATQYRGLVTAMIGTRSAVDAFTEEQPLLLAETADAETLQRCLGLCIMSIAHARISAGRTEEQPLAS